MALFGKKKLSIEDIISGIEALSEDEKAQVLSAIQTTETVEENAVEETETTPETEESIEMTEDEEVVEPSEGDMQEEGQEQQAQPIENEMIENQDVMSEVPTETPESTAAGAEQAPNNYDELIAAQNARIDSLESAISTMAERLEQIVENYDKQNFGHSPQYCNEEESSSRMSAVMQGYAPRRPEQYK